MIDEADFLNLAPYSDHRVEGVLNELLKTPALLHLIHQAMPQWHPERLREACAAIRSISDFQEKIMLPAVTYMEAHTTTELTSSGLEQVDPSRKHLFISNHRDICLDSTFLSRVLMLDRGQSTQMAIGNNLIMEDWLTHLFKLNKTVIVERNLRPRALLQASQKLSAYIHTVILKGIDSFWIAQGEGRSKDGNDFTQSGLIKMLTLAAGKQWEDGMYALNPVPVSISYEWDPCDVAKARELMIRERTGRYTKAEGEDLKSIMAGIMGAKGRVHLHFGAGLATHWPWITAPEKRGDRLARLVEATDRAIISGYRCWPSNYIAADLLTPEQHFRDHYSAAEKAYFLERLQQRLDGIEEADAISPYVLRMYANPVFNQQKHQKGCEN